MKFNINVAILIFSAYLSGCNGSSSGGDDPDTGGELTAAAMEIHYEKPKTLTFRWSDVSGATYYQLFENADGHSGFEPIGNPIAPKKEHIELVVPLFKKLNARYLLQTCNEYRCVDSQTIAIDQDVIGSIGYFKPSNTDAGDLFSWDLAISDDGNLLAVGAPLEDSGGGQEDNLTSDSGAVYIFIREDGEWIQQAYLKSPDPQEAAEFGTALSLSDDGYTLAVGAFKENGENDNVAAGAVHIYSRSNEGWAHSARLQASNQGNNDLFGYALSLNGNGSTLAVTAPSEDGGLDGESGDAIEDSGAVYVFRNEEGVWSQHAYIKAADSSTGLGFGASISLDDAGASLAVGANADNAEAGSVYLYRLDSDSWVGDGKISASNAAVGDWFGFSLNLSGNGQTLAVGAPLQNGSTENQDTQNGFDSGAVYIFSRKENAWQQTAYLKAANTDSSDRFGEAVRISDDGSLVAVGAWGESSYSQGLFGDNTDNSLLKSGAVYIYIFNGVDWSSEAYIKASNTDSGDSFGGSVALSGDGDNLAVGAVGEDGADSGLFANPESNEAESAGAVYIY
ncbi:histidine kinase [Microbulbifer sp. ZKSA006]|uniref:histidine kinase n=1 Tax=Microbulbifer sp. ZKSA006 TaxID=3243390 RepID=UPI0040393E5E